MSHLSQNSSLYYVIQNQALEIGEKDLARVFCRARFDPRLMEVATEFIRDFWWNVNPSIFNRCLKMTKSPEAIKPALRAILKNCQFPDDQTYQDFLFWYKVVVAGIKNPSPQLFYIGLSKIGSKSMALELDEAVDCFTNFNFIAKDIPFNKGRPGLVKSQALFSQGHISQKQKLKSELAMQIKNYKEQHQYKNDEVSQKLGINRVFLSRILNNRLEKISVDYLLEKCAKIE